MCSTATVCDVKLRYVTYSYSMWRTAAVCDVKLQYVTYSYRM